MFGALVIKTKTRGSESFSEKNFDKFYSLHQNEVLSLRLYLVRLDRDRICKLASVIANNHFPNLETLEICRPIFIDTTLEPILFALKENTTIKNIVFDCVKLDNNILVMLRQLLLSNTTIESFQIPHNGLVSYACGYIIQNLLSDSHIKHLNLSGNEVTNIHVPMLCKLVEKGSLEILDLTHTDLSNNAAEELIEVFKKTGSLRELHLNDCEGVDEYLISKCLHIAIGKGSS